MRLYNRKLSLSRVILVVLGLCILTTVVSRLRYTRDVNSAPRHLITRHPRTQSTKVQTKSRALKEDLALAKEEEAAGIKRRLEDKLANDKKKAELEANKLTNVTVRNTESEDEDSSDETTDEDEDLSADLLDVSRQQQQLLAYKIAVDFEDHFSNQSAHNRLQFGHIIKIAKQMANFSKNTVLLEIVDEASIPFVKSWICNTNRIVPYTSVLFVALDVASNNELIKYWPKLNVVGMGTSTTGASSNMSDANKLTIQKIELIHALVRAGVCLLLIDVHSVWFQNPMPELYTLIDNGFDMAVNLVSHSHINTDFLYLIATRRMMGFWSQLYRQIKTLELAWNRNKITYYRNVDGFYRLVLLAMVEARWVLAI